MQRIRITTEYPGMQNAERITTESAWYAATLYTTYPTDDGLPQPGYEPTPGARMIIEAVDEDAEQWGRYLSDSGLVVADDIREDCRADAFDDLPGDHEATQCR